MPETIQNLRSFRVPFTKPEDHAMYFFEAKRKKANSIALIENENPFYTALAEKRERIGIYTQEIDPQTWLL